MEAQSKKDECTVYGNRGIKYNRIAFEWYKNVKEKGNKI
jgi:hypothetical protein